MAVYIFLELEKDKLNFRFPLHSDILNEYKENFKNPNFTVDRFFLNNQNVEISRHAVDLLTEKYTLSKVHSKVKKVELESEEIFDRVPRLIFELKDNLVIELMKQKLLKLKNLNDKEDIELVNQTMMEIEQIEQIKKELSKSLGERVIHKF